MNLLQKKAAQLSAGAALLGASIASHAAVNADVQTAITTIGTDGTDTVTAVGVVMIGLAGVAIVFKWAKASIFG
jgi:hypothetical protein